jgi:hypothetical protein
VQTNLTNKMIKMIEGRASVHKKRVASFSDRGLPQRCDELNKVTCRMALAAFRFSRLAASSDPDLPAIERKIQSADDYRRNR